MSKILSPAERIQIRLDVERNIAVAITEGLLKVVGEDATGKTLFALTEKGRQYTDQLTNRFVTSAKEAVKS